LKHVNTWSLVLAGGEGARLHGLTRNVHGVVVPKQFCSLQGGPSLMQEALQRAATVAPMQRVCTVVAAQHRHWWTSMLSYLPERNVIVQPHNRGTAHGILLPLLRIVERDPQATLVLVPADHYWGDENVIIASLQKAADLARANSEAIYLLGIEPEEADPELGYILPASQERDSAAAVLRFVEKPAAPRAQTLLQRGALWNSFITAASASALLKLFAGAFHFTIDAMRSLSGSDLETAYRELRSVDFSRDVLQGNENVLQVLRVPACGWTDLGTPKRVRAILQRLEEARLRPAPRPYVPTHLNLAEQFMRLQPGGFGPQELQAGARLSP
jgi:mannose-1-phosphate guanylyltransferase